MVCFYGSDVMRLAANPGCRGCVYRTPIKVFSDLKQKEEEYHVCVLSYCPFGDAEDKFDEYLDSIGLWVDR
jgi:hypothetical protein